MAIWINHHRRKPRSKILKELNEHFSARRIGRTARTARRLRTDAALGSLSVALGIIPNEGEREWRQLSGRVPTLIGAALTAGVLQHLRSLGRGGRGRSPKPIRFNIVDGPRFRLTIAEDSGYNTVRLVMKRERRARS
jgi:hypothetical protein